MACPSCLSSTHQRRTHRSCPFNKKYKNQEKPSPSIKESDIDFIDGKAKGRENNDSLNKKRENIFLLLAKLPNSYKNDKDFGEKWKKYSDEVKDIIHDIIGNKTQDYEIKKIAGLKNYDFDVVSDKIYHVEYKHNARKIEDLPQILQIDCFTDNVDSNRRLMDFNYNEFYYNKLKDFFPELKKICKDTIKDSKNIKFEYIDKNLHNVKLISKEDYLENVKKFDKKSRNVFFNQLKELKSLCQNKEFDLFVEKTIIDFLVMFGLEFNLQKFKNLLLETQNKHYVLFSCNDKKYYYDKLELTDDTLFSIKDVSDNTIYVETDKNIQFSILLRWKNGKGILKPAFQIKAQRISL